MLEYSKTILQKVSFNKNLFEKELKKSLALIKKEERKAFIKWCQETFIDKVDSINKYALCIA